MASNVPAKIGKYDVVDVIGRGGMGVVYKALDPHLDRPVAIKMMTGGFVDNPDLLKRFFREAQSLASLQHPNIVTVYDLGDFGGNPYMVMQYMEGTGLDVILASRRQLSLLEKTNIIIQVCNGLSYAHGRGIVHRDIKPANIMLEKDGGVKLFDFGIAHIGDNSVTKTGQIVGTLSYMSPEQVNGKAIDTRTDLFSTGVVLYQLFTNHLPFEGESTATTLLKIIHDPPPPLKDFLSSYPPELEAIILRALAKNREERYHSADEFALDLTQLQVQLKQELISQHMQAVNRLLERSDLYKAKEYLLQVLKVDQQHAQATQMLREVQARIKKEEVGDQITKLSQRAEEAMAREQFEAAQECVEQALALDKNNTALLRLRDSVKAAALRAQKLHTALRLADSAHQDGEFDTAKQAAEEALQIAPDDPQAKALYAVIQRDWVERSRQRQLETYLYEARQDISSRKFTAALEILKLAQELDPSAPQVHALLESASAGREQERRRKDLQAISREIEDALNRDDYRVACEKADEGLARFPEERTLVKLKALAERQRQIEERRQFVDEQLAVARKLLQEGRNEELLTALENAIAKIGPEPRLQSLLTIVAENVQRDRLERKKTEYLQKAKESLRNKEFDAAIRILEDARNELKNEPEIDDLLQFVREEAAADKRRRLADAAAEKAHAFVAEQKYDEAIHLLETALREAPDEELRIVLAETRRAAIDYQDRLETTVSTAEKLLQARKPNEALKLLESQPAAYFRNPSLAKLLETAKREGERLRNVDEAIEQSRLVLNDDDYAGARRVLEDCRKNHGTTPELETQLAAIEDKRIAAANRKVEKAIGDARILTMASEYQAALDKLQSVSQFANDASPTVHTEYRSLQQQNSAGLIHLRKTQIERFAAAGDLTRASELLRQSLDQFPGDRELAGLGNVLNQEAQKRSDARDKLAEAEKAFASERWQEGGELLKKAFAASNRAPLVREQILQAFVQAGVSAVETDWRAAEALLRQLSDLKADYAPPSVLRSRIRERKREEFVSQCIAKAKRLLANGEAQAAAHEASAGLATYPGEASLKDLQNTILERIRQDDERAREERARQEKEAYLREVNGRLEREPHLDRRIVILDEALAHYPQEVSLQQLSRTTRELWKRVSDMVVQAETLEASGKHAEALSQWNSVRALHREYPDLESHVDRVSRLRNQARAAAKANWLEKLRAALASSDLDRGRALLLEARQAFPDDRDLSGVEEQLSDAVKNRSKAQKLLADSKKSFDQSRWEKGVDVVTRALETAHGDAVVREQAVAQLAKACELALPSGLAYAQMLLDRMAGLAPASSEIPVLRTKIEERKREQAILDKLGAARRAQQDGNLQAALRELTLGLAAYPGDQRFMQAKSEVETQLRQLEEQREREREKARQLELERERNRAQEEERKRLEAAERERISAAEEERKRQEALERQRVRAQEEERQRLEALERERIRAEEEERKRKEELEQERQLALRREEERERERKRLLALEQERAKAEQKAREQAKLRELELEREREQARQRELELQRERQETERRRLEEAQRLRDENLRKEEERRQQRELARQQELEQKEKEKARKQEERQRKQAAEEERRKEKQAEQQRQEELRRQQAQKVREEEAARKAEKKRSAEEAARTAGKKRATAKEAERHRQTEISDLSATRLFGSAAPAETTPEFGETVADVDKSAQTKAPLFTHGPVITAKRTALLLGSGIALLLAVLIGRSLLRPRTFPVQITTSVDGAAVTLSPVGQSSQTRQCVTPHCNFDLAPGQYELRAEQKGYQPAQQTLEISAKGTRSFRLTFDPVKLPPPPPPGGNNPLPEPARLEIRGMPIGAELFVGGTLEGKVGRNGQISAKIPPGDYEIKVVAKDGNTGISSRHFEAGRVVALGKDDLFPPPPSPPKSRPVPEEEVDWQAAVGSSTIGSIEQFLQKYPSGTHDSAARNMLEDAYWKKDSAANNAEAYREYLNALASYKLPRTPHADQAEQELAFLDARDRRDPGSLATFLNNYPNSRHRKEIETLRDNIAWERTDKNDKNSLNAYLKDFPDGRFANDAQKQIEKLTPKPPTPPPQQPALSTEKTVDDRQAILSVLAQYKKAYEDESAGELARLGPGTGDTRGFDSFFKKASAVKWQYVLEGDPKIEGDRATVRFTEILAYVLDKRPMKQQKRTTMNLKREDSGSWLIESIQRN